MRFILFFENCPLCLPVKAFFTPIAFSHCTFDFNGSLCQGSLNSNHTIGLSPGFCLFDVVVAHIQFKANHS